MKQRVHFHFGIGATGLLGAFDSQRSYSKALCINVAFSNRRFTIRKQRERLFMEERNAKTCASAIYTREHLMEERLK